MKNTFVHARFQHSFEAQRTAGSLLASTALLLCGLAIPTAAETAVDKLAPEQRFTIPVNVSTPIVLKTRPGAMCDLHAEGEEGLEKSLTIYANVEGYVKFQAKREQESDEGGRALLDCTDSKGKVTRYPFSLRAGTPTADMPAPLSKMPVPKGSTVRPALTEDEQVMLSDEELASRGYPHRPDPSDFDKYAIWKDHVSRPITILPQHSADSGKSHHVAQAGGAANYIWSGYVSSSSPQSYWAVEGDWNVPEIVQHYSSSPTYSSFWIGLDGYGTYGTNDLVQDGTQQASIEVLGTNYYVYNTWYEIWPLEYAQYLDLTPDAGDYMLVSASVGRADGLARFTIQDFTQGLEAVVPPQSLGGLTYYGSTVEWIMERPTINGSLPYFADYDYANMIAPVTYTGSDKWISWTDCPNLTQLWMYNEDKVGNDNNQLSGAYNHGSADINYVWYNFH